MNRVKKVLIGMAAIAMVASPAIACPAGDLQPGEWTFVIAGQGGVGAGGIGHFCVGGDPVNGVQQIQGTFQAHWPDNKASTKSFTGTLTETGSGLAEEMDITITGVKGNTGTQTIHVEGTNSEYDGRVLKPVGDAMTVHGLFQSGNCAADNAFQESN